MNPNNKEQTLYSKKMRNPVLCQKTYCGGGSIMKWAYCTVCKKGCFTNEHSVTHIDCQNWLVEHKRSNCTKRFDNVEYLFSGYDEIKTEEEKPIEVNTELLEAQKTIEQLRTENAALRVSIDSLKMTKASEPKASLPLLEVQEKVDGTILQKKEQCIRFLQTRFNDKEKQYDDLVEQLEKKFCEWGLQLGTTHPISLEMAAEYAKIAPEEEEEDEEQD